MLVDILEKQSQVEELMLFLELMQLGIKKKLK